MSHVHVEYGGPGDQHPCVDLGSDVCIRRFRGDVFIIAHPRGYPFDPAVHVGEWCDGTIPTHAAGEPHPSEHASWERTGSLEDGDLTLRPSIQCHAVDGMTRGIHGFVTSGRWVAA